MATHPLDPLSAAELTAVVATLDAAGLRGPEVEIAFAQLDEPAKELTVPWAPGDPLPRVTRITLWNRVTREVTEVLVSIGAAGGTVVSERLRPGAVAPVMSTESARAIESVRADPRLATALAARGIDNPSTVHLETWPFGVTVPEGMDAGRRLVWTPMWHRPEPGANVYAHPISGLRAIVDLDTAEVLAVEDDALIPIPDTSGPYRSDQTGGQVTLRELAITQPDGPSFTVDGWAIAWERWRLRIGFDQREGLVIHDVRFIDEGRERRIAHRMSVAELVIPYGDPSPEAHRKQAFDTGEFGLGSYTNSLQLGCDCLGEIVYLDVDLLDPDGRVRTVPQGICLHEEDHGILWKHTDETGHVEVRRSRRFVASSIVTVNNYEYGYFWYFYQDGSIEFEAKLTGIVLTTGGTPGQPGDSATELEPGLFAPYHQHIFCARLDLDVDGGPNAVLEVDAVPLPPGDRNPHGAAYTVRETVLDSELRAQREIDPLANRYWKVVHRRGGQQTGYKLVPGHTTFPMADPESLIGRRAAFMYHHLWVTPYREEERYPAGDFPFMHPGGAGLPAWTAADRSLVDEDVVLWYVFGTNHIPRTEDWPVMPVERVGFQLKPVGFFRRSPGIDVAPQPGHCH
ncbi:MAG: primary-amine oxidase [Candidatus Nanopelagicales bacterium]